MICDSVGPLAQAESKERQTQGRSWGLARGAGGHSLTNNQIKDTDAKLNLGLKQQQTLKDTLITHS